MAAEDRGLALVCEGRATRLNAAPVTAGSPGREAGRDGVREWAASVAFYFIGETDGWISSTCGKISTLINLTGS